MQADLAIASRIIVAYAINTIISCADSAKVTLRFKCYFDPNPNSAEIFPAIFFTANAMSNEPRARKGPFGMR